MRGARWRASALGLRSSTKCALKVTSPTERVVPPCPLPCPSALNGVVQAAVCRACCAADLTTIQTLESRLDQWSHFHGDGDLEETS